MLYLINFEELNDFNFVTKKKRFVYNLKFKKNPFIFLNKNLRFRNVGLHECFRQTKHLNNFINSRYKFKVNNIFLSGYVNNLYYVIDGDISYKTLFIININTKQFKKELVFFNIFFFLLEILLEIYKIFIYLYLINICF